MTEHTPMELRIAGDLALPVDAVTQTFALLGMRGAGKSFASMVMAEEMIAAGQQVVIVDPVGVYWGLRTSADGRGPGLSIIIAGGDHGDIPIEPDAGELFADLVVDERLSLVLDLSLLRKGRQRGFMTAFLEALYHRNRQAVHLIVDEADLFAPQRPMRDQARLLGAMEDIVRRGRARGLGITMATQRAAVLNKDVLTQTAVMIALRMVGKTDIDAVDAWVRSFGDGEQRAELMGSIARLGIGDAWFWSPGWLRVFQRIHFRERMTFDSSATPEVGSESFEPPVRADVDLDALRVRIAATVERAQASDPAALRRRVAELERELASKTREVEVERVEVPVIADGTLERWEAAADDLREAVLELAGLKKLLGQDIEAARRIASVAKVTQPAGVPASVGPGQTAVAHSVPPPRPSATNNTVRVPEHAAAEGLRAGERRMVVALGRAGRPLTRAELGTLSGLASNGGTFTTYLSTLRRAGLVYTESSGVLSLSVAGDSLAAALGNGQGPITIDEILSLWKGELRAGERRMLSELVTVYPTAMTREYLGNVADIEPSGGTFTTYLSGLRRRGLAVVEGGEVRAHPILWIGDEV